MMRDFWRTTRWHVVSPGDPDADFRLTYGPTVLNVGADFFYVRFDTSQPSTSRVEYGTASATVAAGSGTISPDIETGFTYDSHVVTVSNLLPATTYYYRVVTSNSSGQTITTSVGNTTTTGDTPPPTVDYGPRYDLWASGRTTAPTNLPTFPTADFVVVPATYRTNARSVSDFINAQPDNTTIVFDSSGGGTAYGTGTYYEFDEIIYVNCGSSLRTGIVLWGYNTKLKFNFDTGGSANGVPVANSYGDTFCPGLMNWTSGGGWKDCAVRGFDLEGGNELGLEFNTRDGAVEDQKGIFIFPNYDGFDIWDNYVHNIGGDTIHLSGFYARRYLAGWPYGAWPSDMDIGYNKLEGSGNQSLNINYAYGVDIHHNIVTNAGLFPIDIENGNDWPSGYRWFRDFTIRSNRIDGWAQYLVNPMPWGRSYGISENMAPTAVDLLENWTITDNQFGPVGAAGFGNPGAEITVFGYEVNSGPSDLPLCFSSPSISSYLYRGAGGVRRNFTFSRNVSYLPSDQVKGYAVFIAGWENVAIDDNSVQDLPFVTQACTGTDSFMRNGGSTRYTSFQGALGAP